MHPDLATDAADWARRNETMANINEAYARGDEEKLRTILRAWEESPESVQGDGIAAELIRVIRRIAHIEQRFIAIESQLISLRESELYHLRVRVESAAREGRDLLEEMAAHLETRIEDANRRLMALHASAATMHAG